MFTIDESSFPKPTISFPLTSPDWNFKNSYFSICWLCLIYDNLLSIIHITKIIKTKILIEHLEFFKELYYRWKQFPKHF